MGKVCGFPLRPGTLTQRSSAQLQLGYTNACSTNTHTHTHSHIRIPFIVPVGVRWELACGQFILHLSWCYCCCCVCELLVWLVEFTNSSLTWRLYCELMADIVTSLGCLARLAHLDCKSNWIFTVVKFCSASEWGEWKVLPPQQTSKSSHSKTHNSGSS